MANTSSAKKAQRVALRRRVFNARRKRALRDTLKAFRKTPSSAAFSELQQAADKAAKTNVISKNTAARMKSRMAKHLAPLAK